jgi:hypothetical protein
VAHPKPSIVALGCFWLLVSMMSSNIRDVAQSNIGMHFVECLSRMSCHIRDVWPSETYMSVMIELPLMTYLVVSCL